MYKLMIVDDEAEIREGLIEAMDFPSLGFEVVGAAENGVEGLRLAESTEPDLVITDIRMPLMDGLTMAERIRRIHPTVQFLILSGYDEFEYARQAIGISAVSYVLKPISKRELNEEMRLVKEKIDREVERATDLKKLRAHFEASLPVMREALLTALAAGEICADDAAETAARYGIPLDAGAYALALIRTGNRDTSIKDPGLLSVAVNNIIGDVLTRRQPGYTFHLNGMPAALLLLKDEKHDSLLTAIDALDEIQKSAERYVCPLIIGVSAPVKALSMLKSCAEQAETALGHANALNEGQVISILDVAPGTPHAVVVEDYLLKSLADGIRMGDAGKADSAIQKLLAVPRGIPMTIRDYRAYLLEILMTFMRIGRDLDIARPPDSEPDIYEKLLLCPPVDTAAALIEKILRHFVSSVAQKRVTSSRLLAGEATAYIEEHFPEEDMSIEKVSRQLHISTSYLTVLFRKEIGKTFLQYLTELRMDTAMNFLVTTDMRTAEISERVGISDPSYFSYSFKRHFGVSPSQARRGKDANYA